MTRTTITTDTGTVESNVPALAVVTGYETVGYNLVEVLSQDAVSMTDGKRVIVIRKVR